MLFNETRQYNIHIVDKYIFLKYETRQIKYTEKIIKLHILIAMAACLNYEFGK